jgi:hypothetical protein
MFAVPILAATLDIVLLDELLGRRSPPGSRSSAPPRDLATWTS